MRVIMKLIPKFFLIPLLLVVSNVSSVTASLGFANETESDICSRRSCISKCCVDGQIVSMIDNETEYGESCVVNENATYKEIEMHIGDKFVKKQNIADYHVVYDQECEYPGYILKPEAHKSDTYFIQKNGHLFMPYDSNSKMKTHLEYCVDTFRRADGLLEVFIEVCGSASMYTATKARNENHNVYGK